MILYTTPLCILYNIIYGYIYISLTRSQKGHYACKNQLTQTFSMLMNTMRTVQISSLELVVQLLSEIEYLQVCGGTRTRH